MKNFALAVVAITTLMASSAFAQTCDWSGVYAGGALGAASHSAALKDLDDYVDNQGLNADRKLSLYGGLHVGRNTQMDSFVSGAELSYSLYNSNSSSNEPDGEGSFMRSRLESAFSLKGRLGLASDQSLVYIAVGPTLGNFKFKTRDEWFSGYFDGQSSEDILGLSAAVGFERQIDEHISFRVQAEETEFRTSNLFKVRVIKYTPPDSSARFAHTDSLLNVNVGLSYKF